MEEVYDTLGQLTRAIDLIPNGSKIRVRNLNKNQYLDALAMHRLSNNVKEEIDSFLKGLNLIIPDNLLSIFDENELEVRNEICKYLTAIQLKFFNHSYCYAAPVNTRLLISKRITL